MAAAALRAAVRQLFQPHIKLQTTAGNAVFLNPTLLNPSSRAAGTARAGNLETLNPLFPKLVCLQNGGSSKVGSAAAAPQQSLGIARLARVMLNYFGVGATAWAVGTELTGGARTAYASAPKRQAQLADPVPTRPSWQSRSGPFFPSILTSSPPSKESQRSPSPDASKAPLRELFEKPTPFERASSPVLSAVYDPQWARARSPPTIGLSGVWAGPEMTPPLKPSNVLGGILEANGGTGGAPKMAEREAPKMAKGLRVSAPAPNSPSAGLGLLMEEPAPPPMAPNIGWELVNSGTSWKAASSLALNSDERATAVQDGVPGVGGSLFIEDAGASPRSTAWSLVLVGDASEAAVESETARAVSRTEGVQTEGGVESAHNQPGSLGSGPGATVQRSVYEVGASGSHGRGLSIWAADLESSSSTAGTTRGIGWANESGGSSPEVLSARGCSELQDSGMLNRAPLQHFEESTQGGRGMGDDSPVLPASNFGLGNESRTRATSPKAECPSLFEGAAPAQPPNKLPTEVLCSGFNPITPHNPAKTATELPMQDSDKESLAGKDETSQSGAALVEPFQADSGSLQRRVSAPIQIQQGRPTGRAFAASAPGDRPPQPARADVSTRVDEVRLLGEALCHSQTRARRAEEAEAAKAAENARLKELLLLEAMQKNTWQFYLAVETSDASLLPIGHSHVAANERQPGVHTDDPTGVPAMVQSFQDSTDGNIDKDETSDCESKQIDIVDCIVSIAFGVAIGVVCFGHWGGIGWLCVRVGVMCGNTDW